MPVLPSGRRIEFSLDRFHTLLARMDGGRAEWIAEALHDPDDLFFVLDAVHFSREDGTPYFADYVAAEWMTCAADWSTADRQSLQAWLASAGSRRSRAEAIDYIRSLVLDHQDSYVAHPYQLVHQARYPCAVEGSLLRQ